MSSTGAGRVYKRGNVWWIDYSHRGERYRESAESERKKDATALLKERMGEIANGKLPGRDEDKLRLDDAREAIEADYKMHGRSTLANVLGAFDNHLKRLLGNCPLLSITTGRMRRYIVQRQEEGAANATIQKEIAAIRRAFNILHEDGRPSRVPKFPNPKVNNTRGGFFTKGDVEAIVAHLPKHAKPVVRIAFLTGWRKGEILGLKWSQVDFQAKEVRLDPGTTKNKEGRVFPFGTYPALEALLTEQREHTRAEERKREKVIPYVFHRHGKRLGSIRSAWTTARKAAGMEGAWFHDLRRAAVRNMESAGVSRSVAMKFTGHKTEAVYRRYAIADKAALEEGAAKLGSLHSDADEDRKDTRSVVPMNEAKEA